MTTMSLEQVRDWHRHTQDDCQATANSYFSGDDIGDQYQEMANSHKEMADAIEAHLAKSAQVPDAIDGPLDNSTYSEGYFDGWNACRQAMLSQRGEVEGG